MPNKQNRYLNKLQKDSRIDENFSEIDNTSSYFGKGFDLLTSKQKAMAWEKIGLLEDETVQEVIRMKESPNRT